MNSFYRRNYYNRGISPKNLAYIEKRQEILDLENKISKLKFKFGESFVKPKPEDFQLNKSLIEEILETNKKVEIINKRKGVYRVMLTIALIVFYLFILGLLINFAGSLNSIFVATSFLVVSYGGIGSILPILNYLFPLTKLHTLNGKYNDYLRLLKEYPSEAELQKIKEDERLLKERKTKIEYWFSLNGHDFETEVARLFEKSGLFNVIKTKGSGDGGVDIILRTKDGITVFIECKAHKHAIGPHVIRGLYGAMTSQGAKRGILISLGGVTEGVLDFIKNKHIAIMDVNDIIGFNDWVSNYNSRLIAKEIIV